MCQFYTFTLHSYFILHEKITLSASLWLYMFETLLSCWKPLKNAQLLVFCSSVFHSTVITPVMSWFSDCITHNALVVFPDNSANQYWSIHSCSYVWLLWCSWIRPCLILCPCLTPMTSLFLTHLLSHSFSVNPIAFSLLQPTIVLILIESKHNKSPIFQGCPLLNDLLPTVCQPERVGSGKSWWSSGPGAILAVLHGRLYRRLSGSCGCYTTGWWERW